MDKIYLQGEKRIQNDFSLEKLLIEVREIKMCLETKDILSKELKGILKFEG